MTVTPTRRRRRQTTVLLTIVATSVIGLAAMGAWAFGWNIAETTAAPPSPTPAPTNQPYATSAELVAAVKAAGVTCTGFRPPQVRKSGRDNGLCGTDGGGELIITVYADPAERLREADAVRAWVNPRVPFMALVGPNWTVVGPDAAVEALAEKLGGEVALSPR